jgi:hypothetical protein
LTKEAKEREAELAKKYRDRAKERREAESKGEVVDDFVSTSTSYNAVAPGFSLYEYINNILLRIQLNNNIYVLILKEPIML